MEPFGGKVLPRANAENKHWAQDITGQYVDLNAASGPVQGKVPRDPNDVTPAQVFHENMENKRFDASTAREQRKEQSAAENAMRRAQNAINSARSLSGKPGVV